MRTATGATPLFAIEAVSLDTETTGLDPAIARIVQLGLVNVSNGTIVDRSEWEKIVDPEMPIPAKSEEIHGISDDMATGAPKLPDIWPEFVSRLKNRVIVGHTIGFDLTVLEKEAGRLNLPWNKPRALCVRMLATIVAPGLADHSLDALAAWLGISIDNRHQALGDARATALVFLALQERLKKMGIETLAQAERASLLLAPEVERHMRAGWQMPVGKPGAVRSPLSGFDSSVYRSTIGEIMSKPPVVIAGTTTLQETMKLMAGREISSVFVETNGRAGLEIESYAILTERDIMRKVAALGEKALAMSAGEIATSPVESVRESAFIYRAAGRMTRLRFRHLAVVDDDQKLIGAVSARDLLRAHTGPAVVLDDTIAGATSAAEMAGAWTTLPTVVNALASENADPAMICRIVSEEIRALTRRASILAQDSMRDDGIGGPPCSWSMMVLGSGGRGESMLVPDQDNAIVFANGEPGAAEDRWFAELGKRTADLLNEAGIPYCNGGVMARNEAWRGSVSTWKSRIDGWVNKSTPEDLLNVDIFFDAVGVHGDFVMAREIFDYAYERGHANVPFAKLLGEKLSSIPDPFTLFGGIKAEANRLDLKKHALFPIAAAARTLAIRHNIARHSTKDRLDGLARAGIGSEADFANLITAQKLAFRLVLENQARDLESGLKPSNLIDLTALSRHQRSNLKTALRHVSIVPEMVRSLMFRNP